MHPKRRKTAKNICENSAIELVKIFNTIQIILTEKKHFYVFLRNKQFFPTWLFDQLIFFTIQLLCGSEIRTLSESCIFWNLWSTNVITSFSFLLTKINDCIFSFFGFCEYLTRKKIFCVVFDKIFIKVKRRKLQNRLKKKQNYVASASKGD